MKKKIVVIGAGSFACNVISYLKEGKTWEIVGLVDSDTALWGKKVAGYKVLGGDDVLPGLLKKGVRHAILGLGTTASFDMSVRRKVFEAVKGMGFKMASVISPKSIVAKTTVLGEGVIIPPQVVVDPEATIGDNVSLSPFVYIPHHVKLGNHIFVSSFANFVGGVSVGDESFIGMTTSIVKDVGKGCVIHPHTVVLEKVEDNMIAFGNPMKVMARSLFVKK